MFISGIYILCAILLVNHLFFLAVLLESPKSSIPTPHNVVVIVSSNEPTGAQVFGHALVDSGELSGNVSLEEIQQQALQFGRYDDTGHYLIFSNFVEAQDKLQFAKDPVCVGLQSTLSQLHKLTDFVATWPGTISLAVFAPEEEFFLVTSSIKYLRACFPAIKSQVSWHLAFSADSVPDASLSHLTQNFVPNCSLGAKEALKQVQELLPEEIAAKLASKRWNHQLPYPQNLMRNVARQHCLNEWVICPDIDMVFPRPTDAVRPLTQRLSQFLQTSKALDCGKCAFVFPLYEIEHENRTLPADKAELREYLRQGLARQYHSEIFSHNQGASKLKTWETRKEEEAVGIAYKVNFQMWYEPVYVARRGTPKFDERYVGYGMTRNTQVYEMSLAGYSFYLLESIFLSHVWGLQHMQKVDGVRQAETAMNTQFFSNVHVRELAAKYDSDKHKILRYQTRYKKHFNVEMKPATQ